jgi:TetR/AcrR family transcriptional regulator
VVAAPSPSRKNWRADPGSQLSEQLRKKILGAARSCLAEYGPEKLRMEKVAREAGCSRATLYRYFSSKEEILQNIAVENFQRINAEVDAEIRPIRDIRLKLATGLARSLAIAHSADLTHMFTSDMISRAMNSSSVGVKAIASDRIAPIYRIGQEKGWVRDGIDLDEAVNWIILTATGLLSMGWPVVGTRELSPDEQVEYLCRFLFFSIFEMEDILSEALTSPERSA